MIIRYCDVRKMHYVVERHGKRRIWKRQGNHPSKISDCKARRIAIKVSITEEASNEPNELYPKSVIEDVAACKSIAGQ